MPHTSEDLSEVWQGQIEASIQLGWRWIFLLRQEIFGRYMAIISEWMGKRCWPWDHQWSRTWQKESPGLAQFDKEHFFGTQGPRFSTARHQSSSAGHAIVWSIVFLFAERNFRLCVNRNFDTIFDPVLPEPNRIFGLLNLSIKKVKFDGARCPFSTFLRLQGDHHCACAQKWCHFSFFSKSFQTKKKLRLYDQRWLK